MSPLDATAAETTSPNEETAEDLVVVGVYESSSEAFERGLVALALGAPFWLKTNEEGHALCVERAIAGRMQAELACFERERSAIPARSSVIASLPTRADFFSPLISALVILGAFWMQGVDPTWTGRGALDTQALLQNGELWRPFTALFLHADRAHLTSNLASGIVVFGLVLAGFGRLRGWLLILGGAVCANTLLALAYFPQTHRSIGASTAIFAALGLLTGRAVRLAVQSHGWSRWRSCLLPAAAGGVVLALYGAGGQQVDVLAHVIGFAVGAVLGLARSPQAGAR